MRDRVPERVAIVLPPREAFSPGASGALGLLARRHASWADGFSATVLGTPPPTPPFADVPFFPVRRGWWPGGQMRRYGAGVSAALRRLDPALIEVHNRPDLALLLAAGRPRRAVTLILNNDPRDMRSARTRAERRALLDRLAGVATSSAYLAGCLLDGIADPPSTPVVLPNCLDPAEVPDAAAEREKVILFAGRVVADKGADAFVAACAAALPELPGWRAEMIGGDRFGPDNPETPFLRALRPRAAAAGVAMLGYRPHADVLAAMARAAIVVVPSRWPEPFGLTALEAMACGAALLCSNRGGLAEVTGEAAVAIDPDDSMGFAAAIRDVAGDPARRAALAEAGWARTEKFMLARIGPALTSWRMSALAGFRARAATPI
jgi:UDP-glucose:(glucosyl)LPS alpha-1,2-glucosyltransferase